jgi:hypothetical protein
MQVRTEPAGDGRVRVTIDVSNSDAYPDNVLQTFRVTGLSNATVDVGDRKIGTPGAVISFYDDDISHLEVTVHREQPHQAFSASYAVSDLCGEWQSFAGGGPAVN